MIRRSLFLAGLLASTPLAAQVPPPEPAIVPDLALDAEDEEEEIVVTGQRERGAVQGDIPPEIQLRPADIRALGASTIAEVLEAIAPQVGSSRGRGGGQPVVLLGGRRISGFAEIRDLPSEAIARIDILPEEVALKYGYRADTRVVNVVLRGRFRAFTAELEPGLATGGGRAEFEGELGYLRIANEGRISLDGEYERLDPLFESERDIAAGTGPFDARPFRTLTGGSDRFSLNGVVSRSLPGNVAGTLNARFEDTTTETGFGAIELGQGFDPLTRDSATRTAAIGISLNGDIQPWRWSLTANAERSRTRGSTDNEDFGGRDFARAVDRVLNAELVASGPLFALPAGDVTTTLLGSFAFRGFESEAVRSGIASGADLSRDLAGGQVSLDVPIADGGRDVLAPLGELSANFNYAVERLSDAGTLTTLGYGLNWEPFDALTIIASVTDEEGAPTVQQLGNPTIVTPNARIFDLTRGETVDITRIDGGNPFLTPDDRHVFKIGATLKPFDETDLTLRSDYTRQRVDNAIASFPALTPAIEAAFPGRVVRDADQRLVSLDARPVNFAQTRSETLRTGINFQKTIGKAPSAEEQSRLREQFRAMRPRREGGDGPPREGRGAGRGGGGRGGGGFGGGDFGRARLNLGLFHTWHLRETVLIAPGLPELDLLDGGGIGARGGQPRHELEVQAGFSRRGIGARLTANWESATTLAADPFGASSPNDLRFGSLTTVNLRLFADANGQPQLVLKNPWLRGVRVRLSVDNMFDARPEVRDRSGVTPAGYEPDLLDPLGRRITLSIRKLFR